MNHRILRINEKIIGTDVILIESSQIIFNYHKIHFPISQNKLIRQVQRKIRKNIALFEIGNEL